MHNRFSLEKLTINSFHAPSVPLYTYRCALLPYNIIYTIHTYMGNFIGRVTGTFWLYFIICIRICTRINGYFHRFQTRRLILIKFGSCSRTHCLIGQCCRFTLVPTEKKKERKRIGNEKNGYNVIKLIKPSAITCTIVFKAGGLSDGRINGQVWTSSRDIFESTTSV